MQQFTIQNYSKKYTSGNLYSIKKYHNYGKTAKLCRKTQLRAYYVARSGLCY